MVSRSLQCPFILTGMESKGLSGVTSVIAIKIILYLSLRMQEDLFGYKSLLPYVLSLKSGGIEHSLFEFCSCFHPDF